MKRARSSAVLTEKHQRSELEISVITKKDEFDKLEPEWSELTSRSDTSIFQTFQWNRLWWKYFGKKDCLRLIVFYDQGQLIGIVPLFRDDVEIAGFTVYSSLRFLGSNVSQPEGETMLGLISYTDYLDFIVLPGYEKQFYSGLIRFFKNHRNDVDQFVLENISESSKAWEFLMPEFHKYGIDYAEELCDPSQLINLNCTWEDYLRNLSNNRRYHARLHVKRAFHPEKKVFDVIEASNEKEALKYFDLLVRMHQKKWNKHGSLGTFYEKRNYKFHREVTRSFYNHGWVKMKVAVPVKEKNSYAGVDLNYSYNRRIYGIHRAVDNESRYYKKGPGSVMLNVTLREATLDNVNTYDFLRGVESFKLNISDESRANKKIYLKSPSMFVNLKASMIRKLIHIVRYSRRKWELYKLMFEQKTFLSALKDIMSLFKERLSARLKPG